MVLWSKKLREARERAGVSQKKLAQLLGYSLQTVKRWEQGFRLPHPTTQRIIDMQIETGKFFDPERKKFVRSYAWVKKKKINLDTNPQIR